MKNIKEIKKSYECSGATGGTVSVDAAVNAIRGLGGK